MPLTSTWPLGRLTSIQLTDPVIVSRSAAAGAWWAGVAGLGVATGLIVGTGEAVGAGELESWKDRGIPVGAGDPELLSAA